VGAVVTEQPQLVVAQQAERAAGAGEVEDEAGVGAAVDEVAEQNEAVAALQLQLVEEFGEFDGTTVNIPDGDEASGAQIRDLS
jgi:hypothetical protein